MKKKITLKDIARELDVSISTASKALRNSEEISQDTKNKVQAFARLFKYRPNNVAISLKNKRTKNIGVIIPDIVHHFFTTVFRGIEKYANARGYNVIICVSDESFDKEVINMELLANGSIDGFIISLAAETQRKKDYNHLKQITEQGIPLVFFDRVTDEIQCDRVIVNDEAIAYKAVCKFIEDGRKRIVFATNQNPTDVCIKRDAGYRLALQDKGIAFDEALILRLPYYNIDDAEIVRFFKITEVDAILSVNELFSIHCMEVVQKKGLKIPEDIAIISFTDGILSRFVKPALTTIAQHGDAMGETAARMLIENIEADYLEEEEEEKQTFRTEIIEATIIERESTVNSIR